MRTYALMLTFSSLILTGCFTVPGKDKIVIIDSYINTSVGPINPLSKPIEQIEYIPSDQSLKSKVHYINQCLINYSWGRGFNCSNPQN